MTSMQICVKTPAYSQSTFPRTIINVYRHIRRLNYRTLQYKAPYAVELATTADGNDGALTDIDSFNNNGGAEAPIHPEAAITIEQEPRQLSPCDKITAPLHLHALKQWPTLTSLLILAATVAALISTATALTTPPSADLIELTGTLTAFNILSSVFIDDQEAAGIVCYFVGFLSSFLLLSISFTQHLVPGSIFIPALLVSAATLAVNTMKLLLKEMCLPMVWESWRSVGGAIGSFVLSQMVWLGLLQGNLSSVSVLISGIIGFLVAKTMNRNWRESETKKKSALIRDGGAWCATLIFMSQPVMALLDPSLLAPPEAYFIPALATGLQVPRAMFVRNRMWTLGTSWATVGWVLQAAVSALLSQQLGTFVSVCTCWSLYFLAVVRIHRSYIGFYKDI